MSVAMTLDAVRSEIKSATRRHPDTWANLVPGDHLVLVEKAMGLPKGSRQVAVKRVRIVSNRVEPLHLVDDGEVEAEGCAGMEPSEFTVWWAESHGFRWSTQAEFMAIECRRIGWEYIEVREVCCRICGAVTGVLTTPSGPTGSATVEGVGAHHRLRLLGPADEPAAPVVCPCIERIGDSR